MHISQLNLYIALCVSFVVVVAVVVCLFCFVSFFMQPKAVHVPDIRHVQSPNFMMSLGGKNK